jgi:hypothetical protein
MKIDRKNFRNPNLKKISFDKWVSLKTGTEVTYETRNCIYVYPIDRNKSPFRNWKCPRYPPPPLFLIFASTDQIFIKKKKRTSVDSYTGYETRPICYNSLIISSGITVHHSTGLFLCSQVSDFIKSDYSYKTVHTKRWL